MKKLEDITYRHELIERYLDADTNVEEEQALAASCKTVLGESA